jgi:ACS family hexuronate transporter-like MFS transporter
MAEGIRFSSGSAWKWWMTGVLFLATVLTYLDRQTLAICEKMVREEFHLNDEQYGQLLAAFRWAYALMQVPAGLMADRLPLRSTFGLAVGLWSLAGAAAAAVFRVPLFMVTRAVLGMGETFNWPCASRIVANTFTPADRSLASGIFNSGAALGALIAPAVIGSIAYCFGWRWAFITMGGLGGAWLLLWFAVTARGRPGHTAVRSNIRFGPLGNWCFAVAFLFVGAGLPALVILLGPRLIGPLWDTLHSVSATIRFTRGAIIATVFAVLVVSIVLSLLRWRTKAVAFWMLLIVSVTVTPCWYFVNEWLIKSLREDRGLDEVKIGGMVGTLVILTIIMLTADLGNFVCGWIIKHLVRRGSSLRAARGTVMIAAACMIAPVSVVSYVDNLALATVMFSLAGFGLTSIVAGFTACQQDLSFKRVGLMSGVVGTCANIVSAIANPAIGAHIDQTHSYRGLFVLLGSLPIVSVAAILVFDAIVHGREAAEHH